MKLRSPTPIRRAIADECAAARLELGRNGDGWRHLERAHVLSQPWAFDHVAVHAAMIRRAWRERDQTEIRGQLIRLVVAGPGSLLTRYPVGNTGRARVAATTPMPITDDDVVELLAAAGQPTAPINR
jgi:hypothetical protein